VFHYRCRKTAENIILYALGSMSTASNILIFHHRWRTVFSFTPRPIYAWWKYPFVNVDRELGEYQTNMDSAAKGKSCIPSGNITSTSQAFNQ